MPLENVLEYEKNGRMADVPFLPPGYALGWRFRERSSLHLLSSPPRSEERSGRNANRERSLMHTTVEEPRCSNGIHCVAYPALGEPAKLSRNNPGTRCFACEERQAASNLEATAAEEEKVVGRVKAKDPRWGKSNDVGERSGREHTEAERAREVWERRKRSVLTCERGLHSALAAGDERLVRRWSRSLREAEVRLAWAEADLARAEKRSKYGG